MALEEEQPFPDLPGIDGASGLARFGGKQKSFKKILIKFFKSKNTTSDEIKAAVLAGDMKLAECLAHNLKGVAGNIGANDLSAEASKLEIEITQGESKKIETQLDVVSQSLAHVLGGLAVLVPEQPSSEDYPVETASKVQEAIIPLTMTPLLQALNQYLATDDSRAIRCLESILEQPGLLNIREELNQLEMLVEQYDFEEAHENVKRMAQTLEISLEEEEQ